MKTINGFDYSALDALLEDTSNRRTRWTRKELAVVRKYCVDAPKPLTSAQVAKYLPGRTANAVRFKACQMKNGEL